MNDEEKYPDDENHGQDQDQSDNRGDDGTEKFDNASEVTREHLSSGQAELDDVTRKLREAYQNLPDEEMPTHIGKFEVERQLGRGAFSTVYLAHDPDLGIKRAIKLITKTALDQQNLKRATFRDEAQKTVRVCKYPGIVQIVEANEAEDGSLYFVLEYIEGTNLENKIAEKAYDLRESIEVVASVASSIHNAHKPKKGHAHKHEKGIVHRDLKPENILIELETGKPFVADFGLAVADHNPETHAQAAGTPAYMSPEQVEGKKLDGRSDIWSLGVILYRMVTGEHPFWNGDQNQCLNAIKNHAVKPPSQINDAIDPALEAIILKCLAKDPGDRYQNAKHLSNDLKALRPSKRSGYLLVAATACLIVLGVVWLMWGRSPHVTTPLKITGERFDGFKWSSFSPGANLSPKETCRFQVTVNQPSNLYVYSIDSDQRMHWLFPKNEKTSFSRGDNPVPASEPQKIFHTDWTKGLKTTGLEGTRETIYVIADPDPLPILDDWLKGNVNKILGIEYRGFEKPDEDPESMPSVGTYRDKFWFTH